MKCAKVVAPLFFFIFGASEARVLQENATQENATLEEELTEEELTEEPSGLQSFLNSTINTFQTALDSFGDGSSLMALDCFSDPTVAPPTECELLGGLRGINVCRPLGGLDVTVCAPKVIDQFIGTKYDTCGCCGENCATEEVQCTCPCQDGKGVLVKHDIIKVFGRQISWNACYTPTIARSVLNAREEFTCYEGCHEE